jgi:hypothetical protein
MFGGAHHALKFCDGGKQDVIVSGDMFHIWNSLSRIAGFIYSFACSTMQLLSQGSPP